MKLSLRRLVCNGKSTLGMLYINDIFQVFTLEDPFHSIKIKGDTRIPAGTYKIGLRKTGGMTERYARKFSFHKGMLHLLEVPNYKYVYIHIGNTSDDTEGCILVGLTLNKNSLGHSVAAYELIYPIIADAMESGEEVSITIEDEIKRG